ncbi:MAG: hypothetical protein HOQ05_03710 [Corynebacteriales bacterium]|nr:hypothetical protein [Mycobacteriales bacterium]
MVKRDKGRTAALLAVFALCVIASSAFSRIYSGATLFVLLAIAAALAVGLSALFRSFGMSTGTAAALSMLGLVNYLLVATAITKGSANNPGPLLDMFSDAMRNSGARILTSTIPVLPTPDTVVLPIVVLWACGALGAEIAGRTNATLAALGAPTLAYIAALILVGPNVKPSLVIATAYIAVAGLALALTGRVKMGAVLSQVGAQVRRRFKTRRLAVMSFGLVVLIAATATLGNMVLNASDVRPVDPRSHIAAPEQSIPESNPLGRLSGWAREPNENLFTVESSTPSRISWVVLNDFDGLTWTPGSQYRSAGSVLPPVEEPRQHFPVDQRITINELDGIWLPAVAQAREVTGVRVSYDTETGALLQPDGLSPDLTYNVSSEHPSYTPEKLENAALPSSGKYERYMQQPPQVPESIRTLSGEIAGAGKTGYQQALLLERYLKQNYLFDPEAPSGHAYPNLLHFLEKTGGGRGTSEQFATAFALLGRLRGLPTRVVVGFHAGEERGENRYQVRTGDAFAWPEVYFADYGWVAFDPTPPRDKNVPPPPEESTAEAQAQAQSKEDQLDKLDDADPNNDEPAPAPAPNEESSTLPWLLGGVAALLVIALAFLIAAALGRRRLRKRRLYTGGPTDRILGAWAQLEDCMRLAKRAPGEDLTAAEVAALASSPMAGPGKEPARPLPEMQSLAQTVNMVAFAPGLAAATDAEGAVAAVVEYEIATRARQGWWRRTFGGFDPRPLKWARRNPLAPTLPPAPMPTPRHRAPTGR